MTAGAFPALEPYLLTASHAVDLPDLPQRRVLNPAAVSRIAQDSGVPPWEVEAQALDLDLVPLRYLRSLAGAEARQIARLLRCEVTVAGWSSASCETLQRLASLGVGRIRLLLPAGLAPDQVLAAEHALQSAVRNGNTSVETSTGTVLLAGGDAGGLIAGAAVVGCLLNSLDEQLLEVICRRRELPLVLTAAHEETAQCCTLLPGDRGVALMYRTNLLHLPASRPPQAGNRAMMLCGNWAAQQVRALVLDEPLLLRKRLLYADLESGEVVEQPLDEN